MKQHFIHNTSKARGVAVLMAVGALAIVAVAITAVTGSFSDDARRSIDQANQSQVEQMLMAGAVEAQLHLASGNLAAGQSWNVELPQSLIDQQGTLRVEVARVEANLISLKVISRLHRRNASQTLRFQQNAEIWKLISAQLDD